MFNSYYRTHGSMGRSFDSSFRPTKPSFLHYFIWCRENCFSKFWAPIFHQILSKPKRRPLFFLTLCSSRKSMAWAGSSCGTLSFANATAMLERVYGSAREKQGSMNVITPPHPTPPSLWKCKRTGSSVAWTYVLQEKCQQRSMNVCMDVLEKSRVAWTLLPQPTPPSLWKCKRTGSCVTWTLCTAREVSAA